METAEAKATSNPAAERALVGTVILWPESYDDANVSVVDFELPFTRAAWEVMGALREAGDGITPLTVAEGLRTHGQGHPKGDMIKLLMECSQEATSSAFAKDLATIVRRAALGRRLWASCSETLARLKDKEADVEEAMVAHRDAVAMLESGTESEPALLSTVLADALQAIEDRVRAPAEASIQTGIRGFDKGIGGLRPGRVIVIAARPGMGKSALDAQICTHAAVTQDVPVLMFSFEMVIQELVERFLANAADISVSKIGRGDLTYVDCKNLSNGAKKFTKAPLWIIDTPQRLDKMLAITRRWMARHVKRKPGADAKKKPLCIVSNDYIGLVKSDSKTETRERQIARMSAAFKELANTTQCTFLNLVQLNRDSEKDQRDPRPSDLRESGSLEQDADMIIFPQRDKDNEDNYGDGPARLIVAKNRSGPTGEVAVNWQGRFTRFVDMPEEGPPRSFIEPNNERDDT